MATATRAAWPHGQDGPPCGTWRLDHILFTSRTLRAAAAWQTLEADPASTRQGLPNRACPSDHLPVGAAFDVSATPALSAAAAAALASRVARLASTHTAQREALAGQLAAEQAALDAMRAGAAAANTDAATPAEAAPAESKGKGKGKGKAKRSEEEIVLLRAQRERDRALKAEQRAQRERRAAPLPTAPPQSCCACAAAEATRLAHDPPQLGGRDERARARPVRGLAR